MSNYIDTKKEVYNYIAARTPLIIIQTAERERAERMLSEIGEELGEEIYYYIDTKQVTIINSSKPPINADGEPLAYMAALFSRKKKTIFAFGDVKKISEDTFYTRELINVLYLARESCSTLILITSDRVIQRIAHFGMICRLELPDSTERRRRIIEFKKQYDGLYKIEWDDNDIDRASALLRGFTELQIDNVLSNEIVASKGLYRSNIAGLTNQKSRLYSSVSSVAEVTVDRDMQVSGLGGLKEWLSMKRKIFFASDALLKNYGLETPKGILLAGVPGCGKSFSAKMVAKEWELPLYRFDIGTIYDKWMGESERKMQEALEFIDNVSPCVLWVDEIEKALAVSDGGNDTSKRILGQFLFWLQESRSRVFMVATANDVTKLPPELFRKGRFSEIFFIDLPDSDERRSAIELYSRKCLHLKLKQAQLEELVNISEGFSYAEIEYAVKEAAQYLLINGTESMSIKIIKDYFAKVVPIERRDKEKVSRIRLWGIERAVPAGSTKRKGE